MDDVTARQDWMGLLARAWPEELEACWRACGQDPAFEWIRPPEIGTAMLRGRAGAVGAPFNLGEMTVTRCALVLECGTEGHAHVQGRDKSKARIAALCDALMQTPAAETMHGDVLAPLAQSEAARRRARAERAAATRVEFLTMTRGEP